MALSLLFVLVGLTMGLLGGGGSILTVPLLVYAGGLDAKAAATTSLLVVGLTSGFGLVPYLRRGLVDVRVVTAFGLVSMLGALVGGSLARHLSNTLLLGLFAVMMLGTSVAMLRRPRPPIPAALEQRGPAISGKRALVLGSQGAAVGVLTGLVGAGGGFMVVPALVLFAGLEMRRAVGTSLAIISLNSCAGLLGHLSHASVDWRLALTLSASAAAGALFGSVLSNRISGERLRRGFAAFVATLGVLVLAAQLPALPALAALRDKPHPDAGGMRP